jgi:hypothetical protein
MPSATNYLHLLFVNLGFLAQVTIMVYFKSALEIKENWTLYRCNPSYWVFSDNVSEDFTYCVQNTQMNMMGYLLEPLNYMVSALTNVGAGFSDSLNNARGMFSSIRGFITEIVGNVFGVFLNLIIEFQKIIISIKDMVGKLVGIVMTIMYVLDGSIKTMESAWAGPSGQIVRAIGSCFHPDTLVQTMDDQWVPMGSVPLGSVLKDGGKVFAVLSIDNVKKEPVYQVGNTLVTGEHFVWSQRAKKWMQVRDLEEAILCSDNIPESFVCLITTTGRICMGDWIFWDWEDDELTQQI